MEYFKWNKDTYQQNETVHELGHEGVLAGRWTDGASGAHAGAREATSQAAHAQNSTHFDLLSKEVGTSEDSSSFEIKISSLFGDLLHLFFFTTKAFISVSTHFDAQSFLSSLSKNY